MTIRLTCDVSNTRVLLEKILEQVNAGNRVMFTCDSGAGRRVEQRLRVKLSRVRKAMEAKGKKRRHYRLSCDVTPWTENGRRYDAVFMYTSQDETHKTLEILEDLVGNGKPL